MKIEIPLKTESCDSI